MARAGCEGRRPLVPCKACEPLVGGAIFLKASLQHAPVPGCLKMRLHDGMRLRLATHTRMHARTHAHMHVCTHAHAHMHAHMGVCVFACLFV